MTVPATTGDPAETSGGSVAARHLLHRAAAALPDGQVCGVEPGATRRWEYLSFHVYRVGPGDLVRREADDQERLVLPLEGRVHATAGGRDLGSHGSRTSVFDGPPAPVLLVEPGLDLEIRA